MVSELAKKCIFIINASRYRHFFTTCMNASHCANCHSFIFSRGRSSAALHTPSELVAVAMSISKLFHSDCPSLASSTSTQRKDHASLDFLWHNKLPEDLQLLVLCSLPYEDLYRYKGVAKRVKRLVESNPFRGLPLGRGTTLTAPYFFIARDGTWQCVGYDTSLHRWRRLPPLTYLPTPDTDLFKEYLVCASSGFICINVSKCRHEERLLVFNPLTRVCRELPPLNHRRSPVLLHLIVDSRTQHFRVVVVGSSGEGGLSGITEVYDSSTSEWTVTGNLPGPEFALNEFQSGVIHDGNILCIAFLEAEKKGILAYNLEQGRWLNWGTPLPIGATNLQLVGCSGQVYLFSEQEEHGCFKFCIDRVELTDLTEVVRCEKPGSGGRSLETLPEYVCVAYAEFRLCVFNTVAHTGVIHDVRQSRDGGIPAQELLQAPSGDLSGECFYSLNPLSFPLELSFTSQVDSHPP